MMTVHVFLLTLMRFAFDMLRVEDDMKNDKEIDSQINDELQLWLDFARMILACYR
jgi:hypothetical protein